jgi:hypothetical protein
MHILNGKELYRHMGRDEFQNINYLQEQKQLEMS